MIQNLEIINSWMNAHPVITLFIIVWSLVWKGLALWKAGQLGHKYWFIIILVINTVGILEIIYLGFVAKKYSVEIEAKE